MRRCHKLEVEADEKKLCVPAERFIYVLHLLKKLNQFWDMLKVT